MKHNDDSWPFGEFFTAGFGPRFWAFGVPGCGPRAGGPWARRGRRQVFESGEMKYVILRLLRDKPMHGYEVIRALEEKLGGWYTPSAGTVYPTLQLLEDEGYVRIVETEGKKVYHVTPEGEKFLEEHKSTLEEIMERVGDALRGLAEGPIGDLNSSLGRLAKAAWSQSVRAGMHSERAKKIAEILRRAADEIEQLAKEGTA